MRPNLALPSLPEQPVSSDCGVRLLARVRQRVTWVDRHRRRRPYNLVGRPWQPSWRLLCPTAHAWQPRASWRRMRPTARAWQQRGSSLRPTARSWQLGASWLRPCSFLSPRGWRASKLRPYGLVLQLHTLQEVEVDAQVVETKPGRSGLVPQGGVKSVDAVIVNWKK
jgi:hypothetical protein